MSARNLHSQQASAEGGRSLTAELTVICTLSLVGAPLAGIGFVPLGDVFAGLG